MKPSDFKKREMLRTIGKPVDFVITGTIGIKNVYKFKDFMEYWNLTPLDDFRELLDIWIRRDSNFELEDKWYIHPYSMKAMMDKTLLFGFQMIFRNKDLVVPATKSIIDFCKKKGNLEYIISIGFSDTIPKHRPRSLKYYHGEAAIFSGVYEQSTDKPGILIHCPDPKVNDYIDNDLDKFEKYLNGK